MRISSSAALVYLMVRASDAFSPSLTFLAPNSITTRGVSRSPNYGVFNSKLSSSVITDDDGPTPEVGDDEIEVIDDLPELHYDENNISIPHQPWRRGDTDGCEDPIEAPWRGQAESIIEGAVATVGAQVVDVTWYMAFLVVTLNEESIANVEDVMVVGDGNENRPEIRVVDEDDEDQEGGVQWFDPEDPEPSDDYGIYAGEEDGRGSFTSDDGDDDTHDPYAVQEVDPDSGELLPAKPRPTRDAAVRNLSEEEWEEYISSTTVHLTKIDERLTTENNVFSTVEGLEVAIRDANDDQGWGLAESQIQRAVDLNVPKFVVREVTGDEDEIVSSSPQLSPKMAMPALERADGVDTDALTTIAKAILDALEDAEEELQVLSRHEVILTCPTGGGEILETQKQFDAHRGKPVLVETTDPFGSNRTLKGTLVDRNALDIYINQKGRMVTVPQNMVSFVRVPLQFLDSDNSDDYEDEE
eukprot:CAMPEP_0197831934 /NCGR_PEP_ID=MMETSP1437-20131217/12805_1 /TAXON_ID=49252 ORGANISM="Eucampia antarctica, Strain CCMP1452" /NCGR_SAMPLE_ID=MMETSP1437 /ASSEMBLY_ACC=CAM_ASM_001096 /LENGTH=470 /DNA_ID=CAMNT_0043435081 /DNA_START=54 /DNA_END=1466 /DNA_ORIENTATION=-